MDEALAFLFFLALQGEAKREEVRARFPRLVSILRRLKDEVEARGETLRLGKPLRLSWFGPLFQEAYSPLLSEPERSLALERLLEAAHLSAEAGEPLVESAGLLQAARAFQEGSQALLGGAYREALHRYGEGLGLLEKEGLPFPATALALLALAQEGFRPGGKGRETAKKALKRARTPFARRLAEELLAQATKERRPGA
uniref:Tetratricopeptide repeat protein n=1 Tax=Thermus caliditerrae TaxID=1330700 RepID=A0A7C5VGT5_9DEIN